MWAARQSPVSLHVILVLGAVFEDASELGIVEVALLVDGRLAKQLVHLLVGEAVTHGRQQLPQVVLVDHPCKQGRVIGPVSLSRLLVLSLSCQQWSNTAQTDLGLSLVDSASWILFPR